MKSMFRLSVVATAIVLIVIGGCKKDETDPAEQAQKDKETIEAYIADNNLDALQTGSGLYYVIDNPGSSTKPSGNSTVTVVYRGSLTNGSVFDESSEEGATFSLASVIAGWQEGIPIYGEGGSGILLIPSALGYGPDGNGSIPENAVLIFDVELLDVR